MNWATKLFPKAAERAPSTWPGIVPRVILLGLWFLIGWNRTRIFSTFGAGDDFASKSAMVAVLMVIMLAAGWSGQALDRRFSPRWNIFS